MRKFFILGIILMLTNSCDDALGCECEYVVYDSDPTNNYTWTETYRSTWDNDDCDDRTIDESTFTASSGDKYYSKTKIECD